MKINKIYKSETKLKTKAEQYVNVTNEKRNTEMDDSEIVTIYVKIN